MEEPADLDAYAAFGVAVHIIEKNRREHIRIGLNEYKGSEYIDIRSFYHGRDGFRPTRRGVTLPTRLYGELLKGVLELGSTLGVLGAGDEWPAANPDQADSSS